MPEITKSLRITPLQVPTKSIAELMADYVGFEQYNKIEELLASA
ncbi:hypothetical protein [Flavihumibacter solisilvae]|nr:hypothetical protein [Flavihumibacter solisilvae]